MKTELVADTKAFLGEGPAWDSKTQTLYWVDIIEKRIYAGTEVLVELDEEVGCVAPCRNGHLIVGTRSQVVDFDPTLRNMRVLTKFTAEPASNRINDGKCDPAGRFLLGSMDMLNERDPTGTLYSYDGSTVSTLRGGLVISNGLAWSPDHRTLYHIDTPSREVWAFDYDLSTGLVANGRVAIRVADSLGWPDGMTSDTDGNLWIAMWGGARVTRWNPKTGGLLDQVPVPALHSSSVVFGGRDLNELYVTSARKGMSQADLLSYPLSGGLFKISTMVRGLPTYEFGSEPAPLEPDWSRK